MHKEKKNNLIFWIISIIGLLLLTWGMISLARNNDNAPHDTNNEIKANDWVKGNPEAGATIIEYSDFQCPACALYYGLIKQLEIEFGSQLRLVFRNFPLTPLHPNAEIAAYAAEAVGQQNKFWEMHDLLFDNQPIWASSENPEEIFLNFATTLNLDLEKFQSDIKSDVVKDKVAEDIISARQNNLNSTPTFFINGVQIDNPKSYDKFREEIYRELGYFD